jgi:hypothetical protein
MKDSLLSNEPGNYVLGLEYGIFSKYRKKGYNGTDVNRTGII